LDSYTEIIYTTIKVKNKVVVYEENIYIIFSPQIHQFKIKTQLNR